MPAITTCSDRLEGDVECLSLLANAPLTTAVVKYYRPQLICDDRQTLRTGSRKRARERKGLRGWQRCAERFVRVRTPSKPPGNRTLLLGRSHEQGTSHGSDTKSCFRYERGGHARTTRRAAVAALRRRRATTLGGGALGPQQRVHFGPSFTYWLLKLEEMNAHV